MGWFSFLLDCQKEISNNKLWIALQANALSDQSGTTDDFEKRFKYGAEILTVSSCGEFTRHTM